MNGHTTNMNVIYDFLQKLTMLKINKKSDTEAIGLLKIKVEPSGRIVFAAYMSMKALKISGHWRSSRNFNEPVRIIISSVN